MAEGAQSTGVTIWLTGVPGAGKSTIARALRDTLATSGYKVEVLDGDDLRRTVHADLGFTQEDRDENVRRIGLMARLLSRNGIAAIVAAISPSGPVRSEVRESHESPFVEVFVDCPLEELMIRDPKGLYRRALAGEICNLTGVDAPYDRPIQPDVHVRTDRMSVAESAAMVLDRLREIHYI